MDKKTYRELSVALVLVCSAYSFSAYRLGRVLSEPRRQAHEALRDAVRSSKDLHEVVEGLTRECGDARRLKGWLIQKPGELASALEVVEESTRYAGATDALLGSAAVQGFFDRCPAVARLALDRAAVAEVVAANPKLLALLGEPVLVRALGSLPAARGKRHG